MGPSKLAGTELLTPVERVRQEGNLPRKETKDGDLALDMLHRQ